MRGWPLGIVLILVALAGCATSNGPSASAPTATLPTASLAGQYQITTQLDVAYGPLSDERLDLCAPVGAAGAHPGVILIHGGGWSAGDKRDFLAICKGLAAHGFVAATVGYRLAPANIWPAQLVDTQLAVRWLYVHAGENQMDPQRLCSWGSSAGGHLAVFVGVLATIHPGDEAGQLADQPPNVACVVDDFGPVDLPALAGVSAYHVSVLDALFGGMSAQQNPALYQDASPIFAVSARSAPMLIVQGDQDGTVPPAQSQELRQRLQAAHVPVQYISYPGGHSFTGLSNAQRTTILEQTLAYLVTQERP